MKGKKQGLNLEAIPVLYELTQYGIPYVLAGGDEVKVRCPFHDDKTPSCQVNVFKREFKCHTASCGTSGDIISLLARATPNATRATVILDLSHRYDLEEQKTIDPMAVERWHEEIWKHDPLRGELYRRGLTDADIRKYRFGVKGDRITIPIYAKSRVVVNVRMYMPGAPGPQKMRNTKGHGKQRLYPIEQMAYEHIMLCGGECKAVVAAAQLNQYGIGAVCCTTGEENFDKDLLDEFKGKVVYVCMDIDKSGQVANKRHARALKPFGQWVGITPLPLDPDKYPKGDINDFVVGENGKLIDCIDQTVYFEDDMIDTLTEDLSEPIPIELIEAVHASNARKRVVINGMVSGIDSAPYLAPKMVKIACTEDEKECGVCRVIQSRELKEFTIPRDSASLLEFVDSSTSSHLDIVKRAIGIPPNCKSCSFATLTEYNVEDTWISPQLEITNKSGSMQPITAYCIGVGLQLNENYHLTGKLLPHPKTQQATLLISGYSTAKDALSTYTIEDGDSLKLFQPDDWSLEGIQAKLDDIYTDLEDNVTQIFERRRMHLAVDLNYHSALVLPIDGKNVKGWTDILILGDSSNGKSETYLGMQTHYGLGKRVEAKNSTPAGIVGGMEKMADRWFVSWGVVPTHDRRQVTLEELKGAPKEVISRMTDMRTSGKAQMTKIGRNWETQARTRLLWISNPEDDVKLSQYPYGIMAVKQLFGALEDVRRLDFVCMVADGEVDKEVVNKSRARDRTPHKYTSELCRQLVLWAWTRTPEEVYITPEAIQQCMLESIKLCTMFSDAIPLCDIGSMRYKLARLGTALAARLFSCGEDTQQLVVLSTHIEYISLMMQEHYSSKVFGYAEFSQAQMVMTTLLDPEEVEAAIVRVPFPKDFCLAMLGQDYIETTDLETWLGEENPDASRKLLSLLVRKHALTRRGRYYRKGSEFIQILKKYAGDGPLPPEYMKPPEKQF